MLSLFPATAPLVMPGRIAMGATSWWEPVVAVGLTVVAIAGLVVLAGRVYTGAILHTGPTLQLRDAWRGPCRRHPPRWTPARAPTDGGLGGLPVEVPAIVVQDGGSARSGCAQSL